MMPDLAPELVAGLLSSAREARERAHAPYSGFRVGAALLSGGGRVYPGCNVENASYGLSVCAERVAAVGAVVAGVRDFRALAVVAGTDRPVVPCGSCLQFLGEFNDNLLLILGNLAGQRRIVHLRDLLPESFSL